MSLAISLSNASAGLSAGNAMASITSDNVANAEVDGFVRREPVARQTAAGVRYSSERASIDPYVLRDQRLANASAASAEVRADRLDDVSMVTGEQDGAFSLSNALSELEQTFIALESDPANTSKQRNVLAAAEDVTSAFSDANAAIASARDQAQSELEADVAEANRLLARLEGVNGQITAAEAVNGDASMLRDQRDADLDALSELLPIATYERADGQVVVAVKGGPTLLDGSMRPLTFDTAVVPAGAGPGYPTYPSIRVDDPNAPASATDLSDLTEGRIGGGLQVRDQDLIDTQREIDGLAQGVIVSFQNADASLAPGDAGLFTDDGAAVAAPGTAQPLGLAGRLSINPAVDPDQGGNVRRVRDGVNAAGGPSQGSDQIRAFMGAFTANTDFPADAGLSGTASLTDYTSEVAASRNTARTDLRNEAETQSSVANTLAETRLNQSGVDNDAEAQRLMDLEQYYAANAQVLETVSNLLDQLLAVVRR